VSNRAVISTPAAPDALGPYSQAVKVGNTVWLSGQIPLDPDSGELVAGDISAQASRVFENLAAVADAAGGSLDRAVKINISLTDLGEFAAVNDVMASFLKEPYPARACVQVAALPRGAAPRCPDRGGGDSGALTAISHRFGERARYPRPVSDQRTNRRCSSRFATGKTSTISSPM